MSEIECPSCGARYRVPASAIGADGRKVQCAKCGEIWFAKPIAVEPEPEAAPEPVEQPALSAPPTADPAPDDAAAYSRNEEPALADEPAMAAAEPSDVAEAESPDTTDADDVEGEGTEVATLPSAAPRRRRRWRDLRRDEDADQELGDDDLDTGGEGGGGGGSDPFAERLARLRQASLAPDPIPRADQESAIRRRRGEAGDESEPDFDSLRQSAADDVEDVGSVVDAAGGAVAARAALEAAEADAPADGSDPRAGQMAEIRRMLDEMKVPGSRGDAADPEAEKAFKRERDVAGIEKMAPSPAVEQRRSDDYVDPLREKLLDPQVKAKRAGPDGEKARAGLMRKHQKRTRRRQVAEQTRKSRGGFYTGLILVIVAFGMLAGVYAFADEIKAKVPGTGAAIDDYVTTVNNMRRSLDQRLVGLEKRIDEIITVMTDD
ncbi:MAG: zinc-ribbon domain-containing protein [Pseudomonadota bacterium]